jgi:pSer/pThr/pTyr-binding forkhead associated (FHA) protein
MALVICCPCGNPIDFEHLELVVTLTCPHCKRELDLELDNGPADRRRAVLTVMEGPHWVGERFLMPVGADLGIGQAGGNWIALEDETVSSMHCRLRLQEDGSVVVEDRQSKTGTWIGNQRIARGKLAAKQSLRVGRFRLRLDYQAIDGSTIVAAPTSAVADSSGLLPTMATVRRRRTATTWLVTNRFRVARWLLMGAAWALALYHAVTFHAATAFGWRWPVAIAAGVLIGAVLALSGRRVTLAHAHFRFVPLALLVALAVVDLTMAFTAAAVASLAVAASLSLLIIQPPTAPLGVLAGLTAVFAGVVLAAATIRNARSLGDAEFKDSSPAPELSSSPQ